MKNRLAHILAFVFIALMLFKVSSFHVYSHQDTSADEIENCEICDVVIEHQNEAFLLSDFEWYETFVVSFYELPVLFNIPSVNIPSKLHFRQFGRPPPAMA